MLAYWFDVRGSVDREVIAPPHIGLRHLRCRLGLVNVIVSSLSVMGHSKPSDEVLAIVLNVPEGVRAFLFSVGNRMQRN